MAAPHSPSSGVVKYLLKWAPTLIDMKMEEIEVEDEEIIVTEKEKSLTIEKGQASISAQSTSTKPNNKPSFAVQTMLASINFGAHIQKPSATSLAVQTIPENVNFGVHAQRSSATSPAFLTIPIGVKSLPNKQMSSAINKDTVVHIVDGIHPSQAQRDANMDSSSLEDEEKIE
ncbi:unnamed protein product, partial [Dovyalis caffra]